VVTILILRLLPGYLPTMTRSMSWQKFQLSALFINGLMIETLHISSQRVSRPEETGVLIDK
jgi:hypothetical protein